MTGTDQDRIARDLNQLVSFGPRFHGGAGIEKAAAWLTQQSESLGFAVKRQEVEVPGWQPASSRRLELIAPYRRVLPAWEMLWSAGVDGVCTGQLEFVGPGGVWGDSIVWQRFAVRANGQVIAYVHARDTGPPAPQPLPGGSDPTVPHLAIGRTDGILLRELLEDGRDVIVELSCDARGVPALRGNNVVVDVGPVRDEGQGERVVNRHVVVCAHYDTFYNTVGAYDNGSGTIALLELLRRWAEHPPEVPVRLIWFTAEEWHLAGSRTYVHQLSEVERARTVFALNVDGLGRSEHLELFTFPERFEKAVRDEVTEYVRESGRSVRLTSRFPSTKGTDDAAFAAAGIPATFFTFNDFNRLHQPEDLPNEYIVRNIAWSVPLVERLVRVFGRGPVPRAVGAWL